MEAQSILTPEQSEKLSRRVKLKGLKQKFGDEFAMINGLAEDFDLNENQTKALRETIAEVEKKFYDKIQELKKTSMQEIINELPAKHCKEAEDAVREFLEEDRRPKQNRFNSIIQVGR
ncbi:hypothetical protein Pla52n_45290 [Stieleria varia]|uniref:Uncharacterized protein n=2 Tax=Stieleria varia TaxID=2528005 RepID=A0A5C6ANS2_9BACT|nr:hypothetical protein Pla52n_45290 [Stieleria varia]